LSGKAIRLKIPPLFSREKIFDGISLAGMQAEDGLPFARQANASGEKSSKTARLR
jgi:hypothetical protein